MEIAPGVHSLSQILGGHVHAFLIEAGDGLILIDTLYDTDGQQILDYIGVIGRKPTDLKSILITHGHRSHLGGLMALKQATGAAVCAHELEADIVSGDRIAQPVPHLPRRPFKSYPYQLGCALGIGAHPPCPVDRLLKDRDAVGPLEVVWAPGHAPGHLAFYWEDRKVLFAGDAIATWPELAPGWPAFSLNLKQHRQSMVRMARLHSDIVAVGHGDPIASRGTATVRSMVSLLGM